MNEEVKAAAQRLFDKMTREDKEAVVTIGMGLSAQGNPILIPYVRDESVPTPDIFEGYLVLPTKAV